MPVHLRLACPFPQEEEKVHFLKVSLPLFRVDFYAKIYPGLLESVPRDCGFTWDIHGTGKPEDDVVAYWVTGE